MASTSLPVFIFGAGCCSSAAASLWLGVLARVPVSAAYPMASLGYVVAAATGVMLLGETVTLGRAIGLVVICLGVFIVGRTV
ncbi:EamA family transporter [Sphingobium nicotianae]|uniref:EamA family transporter n=1 Tax=Sphingobium nicotianae TaxID=2782607 RepID=A0A9X1DF95_9SPHN|nr:EamA family transporter [Sphingobium nicotianae]MBT2189167.1 EamA family transporter [Sphingobium nicotianae]